MGDLAAVGAELRPRLAELEPHRRRVIRVYWTRGLLTALLLGFALPTGFVVSIASALLVGRELGGLHEGEFVRHLVPLALAFVGPIAVITIAAGLAAAAVLRRFGRATVREYDQRFRDEIIVPLLQAAIPEASLEVDGRIEDKALDASTQFTREQRGEASGGFLMRGRAAGVPFAASMLRVRARRSRQDLFRGFFAEVDLEGHVEDECLRGLVLSLRERAGMPLQSSFHPGGVSIAVPVARLPFAAQRVRPNDPEAIVRLAGLYALVPETARALAALRDSAV